MHPTITASSSRTTAAPYTAVPCEDSAAKRFSPNLGQVSLQPLHWLSSLQSVVIGTVHQSPPFIMIRRVDHVIHHPATDRAVEDWPAMSVLVSKLRFDAITKELHPLVTGDAPEGTTHTFPLARELIAGHCWPWSCPRLPATQDRSNRPQCSDVR